MIFSTSGSSVLHYLPEFAQIHVHWVSDNIHFILYPLILLLLLLDEWTFKIIKWCEVAQLCPTLCDPVDCSLPGFSVHGDAPGKNTGVGCYAFLQGIFPTQGLSPGLLHCRWILYCLNHQESPRILEWVAYPFSRGPAGPRNHTGVSWIAGGFFTSWATRMINKHMMN